MQYVSHSSYLVSIGAIAIGSSISMKQLLSKFLPQIVLKAVSEHKVFWGACPQTPQEVYGTTNPKCCPPPHFSRPSYTSVMGAIAKAPLTHIHTKMN